MHLTGFEPAAYRLGGGRSILLSYRNVCINNASNILYLLIKSVNRYCEEDSYLYPFLRLLLFLLLGEVLVFSETDQELRSYDLRLEVVLDAMNLLYLR